VQNHLTTWTWRLCIWHLPWCPAPTATPPFKPGTPHRPGNSARSRGPLQSSAAGCCHGMWSNIPPMPTLTGAPPPPQSTQWAAASFVVMNMMNWNECFHEDPHLATLPHAELCNEVWCLYHQDANLACGDHVRVGWHNPCAPLRLLPQGQEQACCSAVP